MEEPTEIAAMIPRASSTVLLLRDADRAPQVYMLRRHALSDVLGNMYVFPGGKLDPGDCESEALSRIGSPLERLHELLGEPGLEPAMSAGLFFAACRETFEESRVLFARAAREPQGAPAQSADAGDGASDAANARSWAMLREGFGFTEVLAAQGLELSTEALVPWSRWITPRVPSLMRKRFDARFFVAALPPGQTASFDGREATEGEWMTARHALRRFRDGSIELGAPQIMSLLQLTPYRSTAEVLDAARGRRPPLIEPEPFELDGNRVVAYPGDERHSLRERVMIGPTRLHLRNKRFQLPGELDALLAETDE
jgi:8-oxo-dGTP pyrophosphatase MutT (NUDIX family)